MEDTKTVETLSKGNAAVKKSAEGSALILSKMAEHFHKNYGVPLKMAAVKIMEETNNKLGRLPQQTYSDKNLEKNSQFFMRQVQESKEGKLTGDKIHVMRTPLVMKLVGAKILPVTLSARKLAKILENHRESVNDRMLSQLPKALSDPMMVIRSYDGANGEARKVFVLDLKDDNGATMVVPVQLDTNYGEYKVNRIISYYAKNERASGKPAYDFFKTNIELGNVEYVNKKKTTQWYASEEVNSSIPEELMSSLFNQNIPNENDLVKLKKKHPDLYQMTGERAKTAMISRLQKAESMEREAASSKEIWKETGWMRGPDHKWRFEIPDNLDKINFGKDGKPYTMVVALDLKDKNDAHIVATFALNQSNNEVDRTHAYWLNFLTSVYGKDNNDKEDPTPRDNWFLEQLEKGNLKYINRKKLKDFYGTDERLLARSSKKISELQSAIIIKDGNDLVKLKKKHPDLYQMAGERANTAMISWLQKAESMEREAASSKEIWKETGWKTL